MRTVHIVSLALAAAAIASTGSNAFAEDFPATTAAAQFSVTQGFSRASLPVLRRASISNLSAAGSSLTQKLCQAPCTGATTTTQDNMLRIGGDTWSLEIRDNGSFGRFEDQTVHERAHALGKDPSGKTSAAVLERQGRAFIASTLSSAIVLGPGEELIPIRTDYRSEWGQDVKTGATSRSVVASRIVFGKTLHGVPVVGGGSSVVVTFANDGSVESFQYDWPKYEEGALQTVANVGEILLRAQKVAFARSGSKPALLPLAVPASPSLAYPLALGAGISLQKLECGYFDPGSSVQNAGAVVQPGCVYHVVEQTANGMRRGFAGAVPAGNPFAPDAAWIENVLLRGEAPAQSTIPGSARSQ